MTNNGSCAGRWVSIDASETRHEGHRPTEDEISYMKGTGKYYVLSEYDEDLFEAFETREEAAGFADDCIGDRLIPSVELWKDGEMLTIFADGRYERYIKPYVMKCVKEYMGGKDKEEGSAGSMRSGDGFEDRWTWR